MTKAHEDRLTRSTKKGAQAHVHSITTNPINSPPIPIPSPIYISIKYVEAQIPPPPPSFHGKLGRNYANGTFHITLPLPATIAARCTHPTKKNPSGIGCIEVLFLLLHPSNRRLHQTHQTTGQPTSRILPPRRKPTVDTHTRDKPPPPQPIRSDPCTPVFSAKKKHMGQSELFMGT
jgi:hypothetical protein